MKGIDVSSLIEEILKHEMLDDLSEALSQFAGPENYEFDFKPLEVGESVSELVREMRDERADNLSK